MVLVARTVRDVRDAWIRGEPAWLVYIRTVVGNGRIDVVSPLALPSVRADIGQPEAGVPMLVFHRDVVLHAVRNPDVLSDCGRQAHARQRIST